MTSDQDLRRFLEARRLQRRRGRPPASEAQPLGEILSEYMSDSGLARRWRRRDIFGAWADTVGAEAAAHCEVVDFRQGTLKVVVDSAAWLHEMANFQRVEILARLREHAGCEMIYAVQFRLGTLERR